MRPTRVVYVENDPALRGIVASMMDSADELDVIYSTESAADMLAFPGIVQADVALLDLALGQEQMNGVDLGIALRQRNSNIGIVLYSQYPLDFATERVPDEELIGWSTLQKSGNLDINELVTLLRSTAAGIGQRAAVAGAVVTTSADGLERLSARQRAIMGLTAAGFSAQQIAEKLSLNYEVVRQDLARSYRILVPEDAEGADRRTQAVLAYLRLTRDEQWDQA